MPAGSRPRTLDVGDDDPWRFSGVGSWPIVGANNQRRPTPPSHSRPAKLTYEISRYGTLIAWAKKLGRNDRASVLQQNLEEEKGD